MEKYTTTIIEYCNHTVIMNDDNTRIEDSYNLTDDEICMIAGFIHLDRQDDNLLLTRTPESYVREIKAHRWLYNKGLFKEHTKDTDLEEPINPIVELIYKVIGR